ncbi:CaiB/BaiF CoA-transferase family protein [soil metagenome]
MTTALQGIRVLDLSRVLAGPWCTMTLADLGADVIKIEHPVSGDDTRAWGPPYAAGHQSAYYLCANRNKRSVAIDITTAAGQALLYELARQCDVLVENFRAGGLARYGLDYEQIQRVNPKLIYCSISGYGRASPMADRAGYDYVVQAEGGLMSITGETDGEPMKVGVAVADLFTGGNATQAILAALIARGRTGVGQHIDMALFDSQLAMLANVASAYLVADTEPARHGNGHATVVPYQVFATSDSPIVIACGNDRQFKLLCDKVIDAPALGLDPRFVTNSGRVTHRHELIPQLVAILAAQPAALWLERLDAIGIPAARVRSVGQALESAEATARSMVVEVDHPTAGRVRLVASPLKLSGTPVRAVVAPPLLGQHSAEVLHELLGLDDAAITQLAERGVIRLPAESRPSAATGW